MQSISQETKDIMSALKVRCRALGITQEQLAAKLDVSLPTLKRWFAGHGVSLEDVFRILKVLDVSFDELVGVLPQTKTKCFMYTEDQEDFFLNHLEFLSYFDQLIQRKTPKQIERSFKISARSTRRYLSGLESVGLIEVFANDKVKLLVQGEPTWSENGKLALALKEKAVAEYVQKAIGKQDGLTLFLHQYSAEDVMELKAEIKALMIKAQSYNRRSGILENSTKPCGLLIGLAPFEWSLLTNVVDI